MQNNKDHDYGYAPFLVWGVIIVALILAFGKYIPTNCSSSTTRHCSSWDEEACEDLYYEPEGPPYQYSGEERYY